jgi:hypothetical protein
MRAGKKPGMMINTVFVKIASNTYRKKCKTREAEGGTVKYPFPDIDPDENGYPM